MLLLFAGGYQGIYCGDVQHERYAFYAVHAVCMVPLQVDCFRRSK